MTMTVSSKRTSGGVGHCALFVLAVLALAGCSSQQPASPAKGAVAKAPALSFQLPADWRSVADGAKTTIMIPNNNNVLVVLVPGADTVAAALPQAPALIVSEVKDFKVTSTKDLTIAGAPAKHLFGTGEEADDGDPSNAEVIVFSVGRQVYVACLHGEADAAANLRPRALKVLNTARAQ
jgi:ABC-type Fe3+-hydroxamate transport system substrate-binding protein